MELAHLYELKNLIYENRLQNLEDQRKYAELNLKVSDALHKLDQLQRSLVEKQQLYIINEN